MLLAGRGVPGTFRVAPRPDWFCLPAGSGDELLVPYAVKGGVRAGLSLWVTDGTVEGSRPLEASYDGFAALQPRALGTVGNVCLLSGFSFEAGQELHGFALPDVGGFLARPFGQGCGIGPEQVLKVSGELRSGEAVGLEPLGLAPLQTAGIYASVSAATTLFGECAVALDTPVMLTSVALDGAGAAGVELAVPAEAVLVGLEWYAQGVSAVPGGAWLGAFELTNGVELGVGP